MGNKWKLTTKANLMKCASKKTGNGTPKMRKTKSKIIDLKQKKRSFDSEIYKHLKKLYYRDDVLIALPGTFSG